jgi:hypothetical protein
MPPPSPLTTLQDPPLEALDHLPAQQLLTSAQVSIVLQVSVRWLEEQRASSRPPPWIELVDRSALSEPEAVSHRPVMRVSAVDQWRLV